MSRYLLGIDEAGRGSLMGPMIIAGVLIRDDVEEKLSEIGVRDSKLLSRSSRENLLSQIMDLSENVEIQVASPDEIDEFNLNDLEIRRIEIIIRDMCKILGRCPDEIYIDAVGDIDRNAARLRRRIGVESIYMETSAETKHVVVAAASIVAKVLRDLYIDSLRRVLGEFGSGYPSDPRTINWLESNKELIEIYGGLFIRRKWETAKRFLKSKSISTLDKFFGGRRD